MDPVRVLEDFELLLERTIGQQMWVLGVFVVGMTVMAAIMISASRRGRPLWVQVVWAMPVMIITMLVAALGFGSYILQLAHGRWVVRLLIGIGVWLLGVSVLQTLIRVRAGAADTVGDYGTDNFADSGQGPHETT